MSVYRGNYVALAMITTSHAYILTRRSHNSHQLLTTVRQL